MTTFLVSDTHFGHAGVCRFTDDKGEKIRPWTDPDKMNEDMVRMWNETVGPNDKVYHLGDVVINRKFLPVLDRLNGIKILIKGNHDIFGLDYLKYFKDIRGCHVLNGMILTHIPLHPESLERFGTNIHGHTHSNRVTKVNQYNQRVIDPLYYCVCVEQTGFKPIAFDDVQAAILAQGGTVGFKERKAR